MKEIRVFPMEVYNHSEYVEWAIIEIAKSKGFPCTNTLLIPKPNYEKIDTLYRWYDPREDCYVFSWTERVDKGSETL